MHKVQVQSHDDHWYTLAQHADREVADRDLANRKKFSDVTMPMRVHSPGDPE